MVEVSVWSKKFAEGPDLKYWEKTLGSLGLDIDVPVVVQGEDIRETARIWWILRYWGVKDARILNGGWSAWTAGNFPVAKADAGKKPLWVPTSPKLTPAEQRLATKDQIKDSLKEKRFQIIDARTDGEYCGNVKTAKRAGAIPGAVHLEWKTLVDSKTQKFKTRQRPGTNFQDRRHRPGESFGHPLPVGRKIVGDGLWDGADGCQRCA